MKFRTLAILLSMLLSSSAWGADPEQMWITENVAEAAARELEGRGISLDGRASQRAFDVHGREIVWREHHRVSDERGGTHLFYRQYVVDGARIDAEIDGTEVGVHYDHEGRLDFVNGTQYSDVMITNGPEIDGIDAARRARQTTRSFALINGDANDIPIDLANAEQHRGALQVVNVDGELRFVWRVTVLDGAEEPRDVVVDAQDQRVISGLAHSRHNNCYPDQQNHVAARGKPVRSGIIDRFLGATTAIPFRAPVTGGPGARVYSHEGFWVVSPLQAVHQQLRTATDQQQWNCQQTGYSLMALNTNTSGQPYYIDDGIFKGTAGGDAMYHTRQTMLAFSTMGRNSWNGSGANATVVIDSYMSHDVSDQAVFRATPRSQWDPPGASVGIARAQNYYNQAASLDVIAHEWGHGVLATHPNFPRTISDNTVSDQLDEGFADVIGNIVEKLRQPAENVPDPLGRAAQLERSSDWTMHEDASGSDGGYLAYARGAVDDGTTGHVWKGNNNYTPAASKNRLHFSDPDTTDDTQPHTWGNMLVVVLRLLTEGGDNPLCDRPAPNPITTCNDVTALGFTKARKVLWNTLPNLPRGASTWQQVANAAVRAAYSQFKMCNASPVYVPVFEQEQTKLAFEAIGLTVTEPIRQTCQ